MSEQLVRQALAKLMAIARHKPGHSLRLDDFVAWLQFTHTMSKREALAVCEALGRHKAVEIWSGMKHRFIRICGVEGLGTKRESSESAGREEWGELSGEAVSELVSDILGK